MKKSNPKYYLLLYQFKEEVKKQAECDCWDNYIGGEKRLIKKESIEYRKYSTSIPARRMARVWNCSISTAHNRLKDFLRNGDGFRALNGVWYTISADEKEKIMLRYLKKHEANAQEDTDE